MCRIFVHFQYRFSEARAPVNMKGAAKERSSKAPLCRICGYAGVYHFVSILLLWWKYIRVGQHGQDMTPNKEHGYHEYVKI